MKSHRAQITALTIVVMLLCLLTASAENKKKRKRPTPKNQQEVIKMEGGSTHEVEWHRNKKTGQLEATGKPPNVYKSPLGSSKEEASTNSEKSISLEALQPSLLAAAKASVSKFEEYISKCMNYSREGFSNAECKIKVEKIEIDADEMRLVDSMGEDIRAVGYAYYSYYIVSDSINGANERFYARDQLYVQTIPILFCYRERSGWKWCSFCEGRDYGDGVTRNKGQW